MAKINSRPPAVGAPRDSRRAALARFLKKASDGEGRPRRGAVWPPGCCAKTQIRLSGFSFGKFATNL